MISGFISHKCIAQERLDQVQRQFNNLTSKIKKMDDPLDYVSVKIQTPNFPQLEIDRNIFCDNYSQMLREIPPFRNIPELTFEGNKRMQDLINNYKVSVGLSKILDTAADDIVGEENFEKKHITDYRQPSVTQVPSNPYANINMKTKGAQGLLNQYVAGEYYKSMDQNQNQNPKNDYEESNKNNLIKSFKQRTNLQDSEAQFYLEMVNYDMQKALEFYNNNK